MFILPLMTDGSRNYFNATAVANLHLQCKPVGNGTTCIVQDKISVPMANITSSIYSPMASWDEGY